MPLLSVLVYRMLSVLTVNNCTSAGKTMHTTLSFAIIYLTIKIEHSVASIIRSKSEKFSFVELLFAAQIFTLIVSSSKL